MEGINHPSNGLLMEISTHRKYDRLDFYLEVVDGSYEESPEGASYKVKIRFINEVQLFDNWGPPLFRADGRRMSLNFQDGDLVTLTSPDPILKPLPDPMMLRLRSYVTRCAFAKAAGEKADEVWEEEEDGETQARIIRWLEECVEAPDHTRDPQGSPDVSRTD
jgi:hypothetical protein